VEPARNGYLVPPKDAEALARAILELAADRERCSTMGLESRKIVERDLSAAAVSEQTDSLYRRIMSE
jgi:glycosyltransferase involved in cell wall biosynthesis